MAKNKIPDELLTQEQIKRRERNLRYRGRRDSASLSHLQVVPEASQPITPQISEASHSVSSPSHSPKTVQKQKIETMKHTETVNEPDLSAWRQFEVLIERPSLFFTMIFILGNTSLLTYFQASTYLNENMSPILAWTIALVCELALAYLTVLISLKQCRFFAGVLFLSLFAYTLGTMAYGVKKNEVVSVNKAVDSDVDAKLLRENIQRTQAALDIALARKESGNIARYTKALETISTQLLEKRPQASLSIAMIETQSTGLIFLRALLMLVGALLLHRVIRVTNIALHLKDARAQ